MTYDELEALPEFTTQAFSHDCDYTDPSCRCQEPHAPGDTRCANRVMHTACPHDVARLAAIREQAEMDESLVRMQDDADRYDEMDKAAKSEPHIVSEPVPGEWEALQNTRESAKAERDKEPMFNLARTGKDLLPITRAQWEAIKRKYRDSPDNAKTFQEFVDRVEPAVGIDCLMLPWCGMWLGIERDGHTHS